MRPLIFSLALIASVISGALADAQNRAWVQVEAQSTLSDAQERVRAYAAAFPDVAGFQLSSGWYAIVLGPYDPETALDRLSRLRRDNLIPSDSFLANGTRFVQPFWPVGQNPATAQVTGPVTAPAATIVETPLARIPTAEVPVVEIPLIAPRSATRPAAGPVVVGLPDESPAEARRSESLLDRAQRMALQEALKWSGHYSAAIDGAFGPGTRASMSSWQESKGHEPTGIMTTAQRAEILGDRARIEAELGLDLVTESEAGIEISLPMALVRFDSYQPPFVHFASRDDSGIRVVLISEPGDNRTLSGLYDILQSLEVVPRSGERRRSDSAFTIEAADESLASYSHAELSGGLIKGYMLIWSPDQADKAGRALAAMQSTFKAVGSRALDPGLVALDDAQRRSLLAGMEVRRPRLSRSGFYVGAEGAVLTTSEAVQNCASITLDRETAADVNFVDDGLGIALLTPRVALAPRQVAGFRMSVPRIGTEVAVSGYSYEDALPLPTMTFGALEDTTGLAGETQLSRLSLTALAGDAGGPVIDETGAVLGMMMSRGTAGERVLPAEVSFIAAAPAVVARLTAAGLAPLTAAPGGGLAPGDLSDLARALTVLVSCWN